MAANLRDIRIVATIGGERVVRWQVKRDRARRLGPPAASFAVALVVGAMMSAAPGFAGGLVGFAAPGENYAVRIVLPRSRTVAAAQAPSARRAPAEIIAVDAIEPEITSVPATAASETTAVAQPPIPVSAAPQKTALRPPAARRIAGVIPLKYSLAGGASAGDAIEVEKPVTIGGEAAGRIALRIDGNAKVFVAGARVAALLANKAGDKAVPAGLGDDFVSLEDLREMGIGVRYDAIRDRLVLEPPAA